MTFRINRTSHDSKKALADAEERLREVKARDPEVREVAEALRGWRERNHFAERLEEIMGITPKGEGI